MSDGFLQNYHLHGYAAGRSSSVDRPRHAASGGAVGLVVHRRFMRMYARCPPREFYNVCMKGDIVVIFSILILLGAIDYRVRLSTLAIHGLGDEL